MKARAMSSACLLLFALVLCGCGPPEGGGPASGAVRDDRLVVLGPSLVELMWELDLGDLIVAVDRYVSWPPELAALPRVGGYLDPSLEAIIDLHPTSIHSVGRNPDLEDLAFEAGLVGGYRTYRFDTLEDVFESARLLCLTYGEEGGYAAFAERVEGALDSLSALVEREGLTGTSVLLLITRVEGSGSTVSVGEGTFLRDVVERLGLELSAPDRGCYPTLSIESVVAIQPD
ncbi:ABC transporter substrate-binding protein, partial [Candidatus Fermentibacterales bacterium]|nr:ABC transporter substrate-binding protein [Candidatus Fermentibacterales bacterium]